MLKNVKLLIFAIVIFATVSVRAANPSQPFLPSDNIQDPNCTPLDSNCYVNIGSIQNNGNSLGTTLIIGTNDNQALRFETNNTVAMTILANGNVGIGTSTPRSVLDVVGIGYFSQGVSIPVTGMLYVDTVNGNDLTGLRHSTLAFKTIVAAQNAAQSGDTIIVYPGNYSAETGSPKAGVTIYGMPRSSIDESFKPQGYTDKFGSVVTGSFTIGEGNTNSAGYAVVFGKDNIVNAEAGFAVGQANNVIGNYSAAIGSGNIIDNESGFAQGSGNTVNGQVGFAQGTRNVVSGSYGFAQGLYNSSYLRGQQSYGAIGGSIPGKKQGSRFVLYNKTIDDTPTSLYLDEDKTLLPVVPANTRWAAEINVIATNSNDATKKHANFTLKTIVQRNATLDSVSIVGNILKEVISKTNSDWDVNLLTDTIEGALVVQVTGESSGTVDWTATVHLTEIGISGGDDIGSNVDAGPYSLNIYGVNGNTGFEIDALTGTEKLSFTVANSLKMTVLSSGNVGIGTTTPADVLQVFGDVRLGNSGANGCIKNFAGTGITGTCSSDERLKTNIVDLSDGYLDKMNDLKVITYNWNEQANILNKVDTSVTNYGLLAQNVETIFPELVTTDSNGYKQVNYSRLPLYLLKSIQELTKKVSGIFDGTLDMYAKNLKAKEKLCVGNTCVTEDQLQRLLQGQNITYTSITTTTPEPIIEQETITVEPEVVPEIVREIVPVVTEIDLIEIIDSEPVPSVE